MTDIAAIAQAQLEAYNQQDLDAYCRFFTDDVVVADFNGAVTGEGLEAYRSRYAGAYVVYARAGKVWTSALD